jgi:hypothetical protein
MLLRGRILHLRQALSGIKFARFTVIQLICQLSSLAAKLPVPPFSHVTMSHSLQVDLASRYSNIISRALNRIKAEFKPLSSVFSTSNMDSD